MVSDLAKDGLRVRQNLLIGEAQDPNALADHVRISLLVVMPGFILRMNSAIAFNNYVRFSAEEVSNVIPELMLASKFEAQQLAVSKAMPEHFFSCGVVSS